MSYNIGARVELDGESEFRKQVETMNVGIKTLGAELKSATSAFAGQEKSVEGLTSANEVLGRTVSALEEKLQTQKDRLKDYVNAYGEADSRTQRLQQDVYKTTTELNKANGKIRENERAMRELADGTDEATESTSVFSEMLKANLLSNAITTGVQKLASAMKDFAVESIEAAASQQAARSQFTQTFGNLEQQAHDTVEAVGKDTGILATRLNGTASSIYAFAKSSGASSEEAMALMETSLRAAADSAAYYDTSIEDASQTLMSFLKGNYANDAALGVSATETTRNAKAMELFGQKFADLSEIQKQQTLLKMVTDAQELSGAMGQASREMDGWENVMGNLREVGNQIKAGIGAPLLEMIVPALQKATEIGQRLVESVDWDKVVTAVVAIGAGLAAWKVASFIDKTTSSLADMSIAMGKAKDAQEALSIAQLGSPIMLIAAAVAALVVAFITAYKTNDEFREKVDKAWGSIKDTITSVVSKIKEAMENLAEKIGEVWDGIKEKIKTVTDWIKERVDEFKNFFGIDGKGSVALRLSGASQAGVNGRSGTSGGSFGGTVNNFKVDDIRTYQQIEQRAVNQQRTTRMGYAGG